VLGGTGLFDYYFVMPVLILSFAGMIVVSLLTEPPEEKVEDELTEISKPLAAELSQPAGGAGAPGPAATEGTDEVHAVTQESVVTEFVKKQSFDDLPSASSTSTST